MPMAGVASLLCKKQLLTAEAAFFSAVAARCIQILCASENTANDQGWWGHFILFYFNEAHVMQQSFLNHSCCQLVGGIC